MLSPRHATKTPCRRSLWLLHLLQGPLKLVPDKRALHLTASCALRASGYRHNSGAVPALYDRTTAAHQNPHIITSHRLRPSSSASRTPPTPPLPSLPSKFPRGFSGTSANYYPTSPAARLAGKRFTYHISAAFIDEENESDYGTADVTHFDPTEAEAKTDLGRDSYFMTRIGGGKAVATGVVGYVRGYLDDSADFSHSLCEEIGSSARHSAVEDVSAQQLIAAGYKQVLSEDEEECGGSTACVGVARPNGQLDVANLGDSGFLIVGQAETQTEILYASKPQTTGANTPYRLAVLHDKAYPDTQRLIGNFPSDASSTSHHLQNGNVVVFATSGVWDNLPSQEILRTVSYEMVAGKGWAISEGWISPSASLPTATKCRKRNGKIQAKVAKAIAVKAKEWSERRALWRRNSHGGKPGDICVVCMVVLEEKDKTPGTGL